MKLYDTIRLTVDKEKYAAIGVGKGSMGVIVLPEIRYNTFEVEFFEVKKGCFPLLSVYIGDMEVVTESNMADADILKERTNLNPAWLWKVVDS